MKTCAPGSNTARTLLARFAKDAQGGFAIMLAVSVLPLTLLAGVSVDVSTLLSARNQLQAASDEAALALARQPNLSQQNLNTQAAAWVNANLNGAGLTSITAAPTASASQVSINAQAYVTTPFLSLIQMHPVPLRIQTASVVKRALKHVELALVLDNTGSMLESDGSGSTKSATLKSAATSLIDALVASAQASGQTDAFKVAMVPFATYVNIKNLASGLDVAKSSTWPAWMPGTSDYSNDIFSGYNRYTLLKNIGATWSGCVESRPMPYDVNDAGPAAQAPGSRFVPFFAPDEPDFYYYGGNNKDLYVNDYISDTAGNYTSLSVANADWKARQSDTSKYRAGVTHQPNANVWGVDNSDWGPNQGCPSVYAQPLTTNYNSVKSAINALSPDGNTHIPFGLAWGWYMLSPNMPFGSTTPYTDTNTYKIAVLVTDGANTYTTGGVNQYCNSYYPTGLIKNTTDSCGTSPGGDMSVATGYGYVWQLRIAQNGASNTDVGTGDASNPALSMNDRLVKLCRNMQAKGVILYTVPLRVTDANTKAMLQGCASPDNVGPQGTKYLEAQSGAQLQQVFANIAGQISALRLAQ